MVGGAGTWQEHRRPVQRTNRPGGQTHGWQRASSPRRFLSRRKIARAIPRCIREAAASSPIGQSPSQGAAGASRYSYCLGCRRVGLPVSTPPHARGQPSRRRHRCVFEGGREPHGRPGVLRHDASSGTYPHRASGSLCACMCIRARTSRCSSFMWAGLGVGHVLGQARQAGGWKE